jgi:hypothetical protein
MSDQMRVLRERSFRYLFLSQTLSLIGSSAAPIALAFAVLALPGSSPTDLGMVLFGRSAAQVIFVLCGGVLADRFSRYRVMVTAELLAGVSQACVAALVLTDSATVPVLIALQAINGAAAAMFLPASTGVLPQILPGPLLQPGNALLRVASNAASIVGAAAAGVLVAGVGPGWALAADAASFGISAALLTRTRISGTARASRTSMLADLRHGWREFASRQWIWVVVAQFAVLNACANGGINVLGPVVAAERLGGAPAWSAIVATQSAGFLVGGIVAMRVRPRRPILVAVLLTLGFAPPFFLLALGAPTWLVATSTLVSGVCGTTFSVLWATTLQTRVPGEMLSRISSYDALGSYLLGPLGLAIVGPLANGMGVLPTLVLLGTLSILATALALLSPEVRTLTSESSVRPGHAAVTRG